MLTISTATDLAITTDVDGRLIRMHDVVTFAFHGREHTGAVIGHHDDVCEDADYCDLCDPANNLLPCDRLAITSASLPSTVYVDACDVRLASARRADGRVIRVGDVVRADYDPSQHGIVWRIDGGETVYYGGLTADCGCAAYDNVELLIVTGNRDN